MTPKRTKFSSLKYYKYYTNGIISHVMPFNLDVALNTRMEHERTLQGIYWQGFFWSIIGRGNLLFGMKPPWKTIMHFQFVRFSDVLKLVSKRTQTSSRKKTKNAVKTLNFQYSKINTKDYPLYKHNNGMCLVA